LHLRRSYLKFSILLLNLVLLWGCAQRESDIGRKAIVGLPDNNFATAIVRDSVAANFKPHLTNGRGLSLQVGNAKHLFAFSVFKFDFLGAILDSVRADTLYRVDSAIVSLHRVSVWPDGDTSGIRIRVREVRESWDENSLLTGALAGREGYPIVDSIRMSTGPNDTTFAINLPREVFMRWIRGDSTTYGLLLEPISAGNFVEFASDNSSNSLQWPSLVIKGRNLRADTTFSSLRAAPIDGYMVIDSAYKAPDHFYLTRGLSERAALYFPADTLARIFSRSVNRAELHIFADTLDPAVIRYKYASTLAKYGTLPDTSWLHRPDSLSSDSYIGNESNSGMWNSTTSEMVIDISNAVASWVDRPATNTGLQLLCVSELDILARESFYGPSYFDINKRPTLHIWYTERP
jgi:hypothetical protein